MTIIHIRCKRSLLRLLVDSLLLLTALLFGIVISSFSAKGDTIPVWTEPPIALGPGIAATSASQSTDGLSALLDVSYNYADPLPNAQTSNEVQDQFTLAVGEYVTLEDNIQYSASGYSCNDFYCSPQTAWSMSYGFTGYTTITDSSDNTQVNLPFGDKTTSSGTCPSWDAGECFAGGQLSADVSATVYLAAGTYDYANYFADANTAVGDSNMIGIFSSTLTDPTPTPEPELAPILTLSVFLIILSRRKAWRV